MRLDASVKQFVESVNKKSKGYHNVAVELIKICRYLYGVSKQSHHRQDRRLQGVLRYCDVALKEAALVSAARSAERGPIEHIIREAARKLDRYEREFHPSNVGAYEKCVEAAIKIDKKSSKSKSKRINLDDDSFGVVRFQILRSLPDVLPEPIIMQHALMSTELADTLWNFILAYNDNNVRRLSVAQNPHFFLTHPTLENGTYQGELVAELSRPYPTDTIYILTNNERRVYLEFGETRWTFDHVWKTTDGLSFKDITGRLESETTVEATVPDPPFVWFCMNPPDFICEVGGETENWRAPILQRWHSPGTHILIMNNDQH